MIQEAIRKVVGREDLTADDAHRVMLEMFGGSATQSQMASFITAMRMKGETEGELIGFARAMRERASRISAPENAVDLCGTGGDGLGTFNISTVASFVVSAAGVPVAKHGNRSVSSKSGSADLMMALGIPHDLEPLQVEVCMRRTGIGFLFAPTFHMSMANVLAPRREIGIRTFFNILGPLTNPAGVKRQLIGVYDGDLAPKIARVLAGLGTERALVVSSHGTDEITNIDTTRVVELSDGSINGYEISPEMFGIERGSERDLRGGDANRNARIALSILRGERSPRADAVAMNAAAAIYVSGEAKDLADGLEMALGAMRGDTALEKLKEFADVSMRLDAERQQSQTPETLLTRRINPDILRARCGEISNHLIPKISGMEGGGEALAALDERVTSAPTVLSAIALRRIFRVLQDGQAVSDAGLPKSPMRLSDAIRSQEGISIIGEFKPSSPTRPPLSPPPDPKEALDVYMQSGVAGVSVLVERDFFSGGEELFSFFRSGSDIPMLFKDFIATKRQIETASRLGADAVLLIAGMLVPAALETLIDRCGQLAMEPLVEIHDEGDLLKLKGCGNCGSLRMVGVNSRDLRSMSTDLGTVGRLRPLIPKGKIVIAESGINSPSDLASIRGCDAALIGSMFMRDAEMQRAVDEMVLAGRSVGG